jgi:pyruvate,water dikinase
VAVRSSALGEDSATAAFAGQQETFLWVQDADRVVAAIRDCWASLYTARAVAYRAKRGREGAAPAMGVAVQEMIDARISGVMFTCSPASGDPSVIAVNASWGLGEAVVAGEVTPDELLVSKVTGEVIRETISDKTLEHVPAPHSGGTAAREVEPARRRERCLADDELEALLDLARRIERHFGRHQDVEWAIARGGGVFVLQSRPVTVAQKKNADMPAEPADAISLVMGAFGVRQ